MNRLSEIIESAMVFGPFWLTTIALLILAFVRIAYG